MLIKSTKRFMRRRFGKRQNQAVSFSEQAEHIAERHFFKRLDRLTAVRRFVISWLLLFALLSGVLVGQIRALDDYFQTLIPVPGGVYTEGILGDFSNANPLYANTQVDESVSRLLFASLFTYDDNNKLIGDLAEGYTVDETARIYTVTLKRGLTWHDGAPLTARDVEYTYRMIQNPDALSVLNQSWQGIDVAAVDDRTVKFTLPNILGSFPYNMTNGIIPQHVLKDVSAGEMRSISFNTTQPVGAGPFAWDTIEVSGETPETRQALIALKPFDDYHAGKPKLASFVIHAYHDKEQLAVSFKKQELTGASFTETPEDIAELGGVRTNSFLLSAANMVFFKQSNPVFAEAAVRKALVQSVNVQAIIDSLEYPTRPVRGPMLLGQLANDKSLVQPGFDPAIATTQLEAAGWKLGADGIRTKGAQSLKFTLYAQDMPENQLVSDQLAKAWRSVGAQADIRMLGSEDLQRIISGHDYDALLYGISIGVDPDTFVYWHSSQNDARSNRLNFSEYKSKVADVALEAGRTRIEPDLRAVKYKPFLQAWQQDTPALGLYQPRYLYLTHGTTYGLKEHTLNSETDRYSSVEKWQIRQADVTNKP